MSVLFLHIGKGNMIKKEDVVFIGDIESTKDSKITEEFFDIIREEGFIINNFDDEPRSFILTGEKIYLSIISSNTLRSRMEEII
ncbi:MAG TPA: extracellular matrix/biofilm biosynthesis regulator RemA family protein [Halanaerobiales bacterium]|nr:extracellular matrix/biofilm biosynthesis regulator RemA family protein [Halanaerobiales bacterium]